MITGGASGLGLALALEAGKRGYRVALVDIHEQRAQEALQQLAENGVEAFYCQADVRHEKDIRAAIQRLMRRWGQLDVMINNAGVAAAGLFETVSEDDWQWLSDINVRGVMNGCRAAIGEMKRQQNGHLVNIASMAALTPSPGLAHYSMSKAAVLALSEALQAELSPLNIQVTVACPSFFSTNLSESLRTPDPVSRARFEKLLKNREISAEKIAQLVWKAVAKGQFLVVPQRQAKLTLWRKWLRPARYWQDMKQVGARVRR